MLDLVATFGVKMKFEDFINTKDAIFHYTTKKIFFEHIMQTMKLKLSPLEKMNDPKEYSSPNLGYYLYGYEKTDPKISRNAQTRLREKKLKEWKIACFCSNIERQTKGYLRSRMWSQYGEKHYGVCVVFSKKAFEKIIDEKYNFEAVNYTEKTPLETDFQYNEIKPSSLESSLESFLEKNYVEVFFTKCNDYCDEAEFRLLKRIKEKEKIVEYIDIKNCLKGIIVGDRFDNIYLPILKEKEIEFRKCYYDSDEGRLRIFKH